MLHIWCEECDVELTHSNRNAHSVLAVAESIAEMTVAMKAHQRDVHNDRDINLVMKLSIAGVE